MRYTNPGRCMGKAIVYCGDCGKSLFEEDFVKGRAHTHESGPYCVQCRPRPAPTPGAVVQQGSSARLRAISAGPSSTARIPKPPSTTRLPAPPSSTRRSAASSSGGSPKALVLGGVLAGIAVLAILIVALSGGGKNSPRPGTPAVQARPPSSPAVDPDKDKIEREMRERRGREEASKLDSFLSQIRAMVKDTPRPQERRVEIEGMLSSAEKSAGPRRAEIDALRAEFAARIKETEQREQAERFELALSQIRDLMRGNLRDAERRAEVEKLLAEAGKEAGPRRSEIDALRAEFARKSEAAAKRQDLLGWWRLDGNAEDSSGLGFHGKVKGAKTVPGKIGQALWFGGESDVVTLPSDFELNRIQEESYTVMAWLRPEDVPPGIRDEDNKSYYAVIIKEGMHIGLSYLREQTFEMCHWAVNTTGGGVKGRKSYPPGSWHHAAGTVDRPAGKTALYVNGIREGETTWPAGKATHPYGNKPWRIGHAMPGAKEWAWPAKGAIDDVRLYGRALLEEEIRKVYEAGLAGREN